MHTIANTAIVTISQNNYTTMGQVLRKLLDVFFTKKLDMVVIGLENSGKTTLLSALAHGR